MTPIQTKIHADLQAAFGITPDTVTPVTGGYLNKKWKLQTSDGQTYLLKLFSPTRYSPEKYDRLEAALQRQKYVHACGVSCPRVYDVQGQILRRIPTDITGDMAYMLMSYENGTMPTPASVTAAQMTSLGEQCAKMHAALAALDATGDHYYPLDSAGIVKRLSDHRASLSGFTDYQIPPKLDAILPDLDAAFFDRLPRQLCHEDFSADNLLFCGDTAIILDFDRGQYSFPLHDIGRALLSLALDGGVLRRPFIRAFADGYRKHRPLTQDDLADALRITFACEFPWWIRPDYEKITEPKVWRFVREMYFLMQVWEDIPSITAGG